MNTGRDEAAANGLHAEAAPAATKIYEGPVIGGKVSNSPLIWRVQGSVSLIVGREHINPDLQGLAQAITQTLEGLPALQLSEQDRLEAERAGAEALDEAGHNEPNRSKIQRALAILKGVLAPTATGLVTGSTQGAQEWALTAIQHLSLPLS